MSKYIDSGELLKILSYMRSHHKVDIFGRHFLDCYRAGEEYLETMDDVIESVCLMPAADVAEVRHGHWEKVDDNPYEYVASCSVCRNEVKQPTCMLKPIYSYCPICGARMVKKDE